MGKEVIGTEIKNALAKVRSAVSSKNVIAQMSHIVVKDGYVMACDGRMTAAAPWPIPRDHFVVPEQEFSSVMDRIGWDADIKVETDYLEVKKGRFRARIRTLAEYDVTLIEAIKGGKKVRTPSDFADCLREVRPFISDNATQDWAMCAWLTGEKVYATNNISLIEATCKGASFDALLPAWAIDYVTKRTDQLLGLTLTEGSVQFHWADKSWLRTQLVNAVFPAQVKDLLMKAPKPKWRMPPEWVEAYDRVASLTSDYIEFHADRIVGISGAAQVEENAKTPLPKGVEKTVWANRYLRPVLAAASVWQPDLWPAPTPFQGDKVRGIIVGRSG